MTDTTLHNKIEMSLQDMEKTLGSFGSRDEEGYKQEFDELREHLMNMRKNLDRTRSATGEEIEATKATMNEMWETMKGMYDGFIAKWK